MFTNLEQFRDLYYSVRINNPISALERLSMIISVSVYDVTTPHGQRWRRRTQNSL